MSEALAGRLAGWLAATDIALLELHGPGVRLRLFNDGTRVEPLPDDAAVAPAQRAERTQRVAVPAPSVGTYLHAHPLREAPLVAPGEPVAAGQVIGLLRIGALLLPVPAPQAGAFVEHAVAHLSTVGYGTTLAHLAAETPARTS